MVKKNNQKASANIKDKTPASIVKQQKKPKINVIDSIFKTTKQKKIAQKQQKKASRTIAQIEEQKKQKKQKKLQKQLKEQWKIQQKLRKLNNGQIPSTKKSQSGIKIYSEQQLNIGKGGDTKLCPIDCNCCF